MSRNGMYAKMAGVFLLCSLGGPAIMYYVTPSEGELFKRFSPELQKRNLDLRDERTKNYEEFVTQLKEYSKSDKPIWVAAEDAARKAREDILSREKVERDNRERVKAELRAELSGQR